MDHYVKVNGSEIFDKYVDLAREQKKKKKKKQTKAVEHEECSH